MQKEDEAEDTICLDESFFVNRDYDLTTFTFGSHVLKLFCLRSASTDYDLTGQLVWPGSVLLNDYLSKNAEIVEGRSVIELGSGVGITGILCSRFCREVVLTDHNEEVLEIMKKNIELHLSSEPSTLGLTAEKLEWGNSVQISEILQRHPGGFDLVLGADICFQQSSIPLLFDTVKKLLRFQEGKCRFILAYVSRAKRYKLAYSSNFSSILEPVVQNNYQLFMVERLILVGAKTFIRTFKEDKNHLSLTDDPKKNTKNWQIPIYTIYGRGS